MQNLTLHRRELRGLAFATSMLLASTSQAAIIGLDLIETGDDAVSDISTALIDSTINVVASTETYVGRVGDGNLAQSAVFDAISITNGSTSYNLGVGAMLTTGVANVGSSNLDTSFDHNSVGVIAPGTGSDSDIETLLTNASAPSTTTNDVNSFEFSFVVDPQYNAISLDFIFASEEFPDQGVTDSLGIFVDGINYAFFADGSLVSFTQGVNASQFNDNTANTFNTEYDGFSNELNLIGLLDSNLSTHTIKIAIADTSDSSWDSAVFLSNLKAVTTTTNTGGVSSVDSPTTFVLFLVGLLLVASRKHQGRSLF